MKLLAPFVILALLALIVRHPVLGLALVVIITARPVIKWVVRLWFKGFLLGKGVKASHVLRDFTRRLGDRFVIVGANAAGASCEAERTAEACLSSW